MHRRSPAPGPSAQVCEATSTEAHARHLLAGQKLSGESFCPEDDHSTASKPRSPSCRWQCCPGSPQRGPCTRAWRGARDCYTQGSGGLLPSGPSAALCLTRGAVQFHFGRDAFLASHACLSSQNRRTASELPRLSDIKRKANCSSRQCRHPG